MDVDYRHVACAGATAAVIGLTALGLAAPAAGDAAGVQTLLGNLSQGYTPGDCQPSSPLGGPAVAGVRCGANHDQGGPQSTFYYLYANPADLNADFNVQLEAGSVQPFPDGTRGPADWHYDSTPNQPAGSYAIVKFPDGSSNVVWTNNADLMMGMAQAQADGATLYNWWLAEA
jgi:hypothetical protein